VDDVDRAICHVLQIAPRLPWVDVGAVVGISATACAARWKRLTGEGLAWVSVQPVRTAGAQTTAIVEVRCAPANRRALARTLAADARIVGLDESTDAGLLLATVITPDLGGLTRLVLDDLGSCGDVAGVDAHVVTQVIRDGSAWRLDDLDSDQIAEAGRLDRLARADLGQWAPRGAAPAPARAEPLGPEDRALVAALARDGRASVAELARRTQGTPATVRRRLARLVGTETIRFRCEVAHAAAGWPITAIWFARVPPAESERTIAALGSLAHLRLGVQTTGEANLVFSVFSRSVAGVASFEKALGGSVRIEVLRSMFLLRSVKRMGWIVDESGRRTGSLVVPAVAEAAAGLPSVP